MQSIKAFVDGITAAVIGALAGAVAIIAIRNITDIPTALIALTSIFILIYLKKIKEPYIILLAAITGLILKTFL
ncbi:MAG: chromate transporter [Ginsengibacter sp.]